MSNVYHLWGFCDASPQVIVAQEDSDFLRGRAISLEEVAAISEAIRVQDIPAPARPILRRPDKRIDVKRVSAAPNAETSKGREVEPPVASQNFWQGLASRVRNFVPGLWRARLIPLVGAALQAANESKPFLIYGEPAVAAECVNLLNAAACDALSLATSARSWGRSGLARPQKGSLAALLQEHGGNLSSFGAILLLGHSDFEEEVSALFDCTEVPPVFVDRLDAQRFRRLADSDAGHPPGQHPAPRITIVTVSFNQAQFLETCIRSVLDQNYSNLEYIIVDGGSTDGSVEIIERYRDAFTHVIIEPDRGQSDALNKGFRLATGDVMNWICSDDALAPGALAHVARAFRRHGTDLIAGACIRETSNGCYTHHSALPLGRTIALDPYDVVRFMGSWQKGNYFFQPEVFFSRRIWLASGAYLKEHLYYAMDYDLWLRMALAGAWVRAIAPPIGYSREHALQKTCDSTVYLHHLCAMMREYLEMFDALIEASAASSP
jgi:GT2 family glycosyltransferase